MSMASETSDRDKFLQLCKAYYRNPYSEEIPSMDLELKAFVIKYYCAINGKELDMIDNFINSIIHDEILFMNTFQYSFKQLSDMYTVVILRDKNTSIINIY